MIGIGMGASSLATLCIYGIIKLFYKESEDKSEDDEVKVRTKSKTKNGKNKVKIASGAL